MLLQLLFTGICIGSIYSLIALSLNLTYWTSRSFNFAQGSLLMFSPMATLALVSSGMNLWLALLVGLLITLGIGYLIEVIAVKPLLQFSGDGWMVTTLGFAIILQAIASILWGAHTVAFPEIIFGTTDYLKIFNIRLSLQLLLILSASIVLMIGLTFFMKYTIWGKAMRAVSEDVEAARLLSIRSGIIITASFIISAVIAGVAGSLVAPVTGISPAFGMSLMIKGFVAAVIGGMGSATGAMIGGVLLGVIEILISGYISSGLTDALVFALLIFILSARPQGLLGEKDVVRV
ncbi:branched-chain amino acid ABC transporter permease [Bacillus sp. EB106-08-02-XG196]|uniref:branched-chain amino acid ABC transporter permease n=1 Tax=Bacillus sp. EB106-08-02-XG196 TaxID=2737049 RepID=UPI0015C4C872|nr:branched-chain amino acid ABC transporter permease [Bacillus sp. EB106-08-02-XG196]